MRAGKTFSSSALLRVLLMAVQAMVSVMGTVVLPVARPMYYMLQSLELCRATP